MNLKSSKSNLLQTKFFKPRLTFDHISRPNLIERLNMGSKLPLILVSAPAGYGKTTLVSGWLETHSQRYSWLSLDEYNNEPIIFLSYFVESIRKSVPDFGEEVIQLIKASELPPIEILTNYVINQLANLQSDLILALDDYHFINNLAIHEFIDRILQFPPPKFHLLLITRRDPAFKIQIMRSKNLIAEIRAADLSFTNKEIEIFLERSSGKNFDSHINKKISQITEGWVAGVRLFTLKFNNNINDGLEGFEIGGRSYMRLMMEEVLDKLPSRTREYIFKTSILYQFNAKLCDGVCGEYNRESSSDNYGQEFISSIERSNLFIVALDDRNGWYRFHHLFQDYLQTKLRQYCNQKDIAELHIKAGNWLKENGYFKGALVHFIYAKSFIKAIKVFEELKHEFLNQHKWHELKSNIQIFPPDVITQSVELRLAQCWINIYDGKTFEMFDSLAEIEKDINSQQLSHEGKRRLQAELNCLLPYKTYNIDKDYELCIAQCEFALNNLAEDQQYIRGYAWIFLIGSLQVLNRYQEAVEMVITNLEDKENSLLNTHLYLVLSFIQWIEGDIDELKQTARQLIRFGEKDSNLEAKANGHHFYGICCYMTNDLEGAEQSLNEAYRLRHYTIGVTNLMNSIALAHTYMAQGSYSKAEDLLQEAKQFAAIKSGFYFITMIDAALSEVYLAREFIEKAYDKVKITEKLPLVPFSNFYAPQFSFVKVLIYCGDHESISIAKRHMIQIESFLSNFNNKIFIARFMALKAILVFDDGKRNEAFKIIDKLVKKTRAENMIRVFLDAGPKMLELLNIYKSNSCSEPIVDAVIRAFGSQVSTVELTSRELEILPLLRMSNKEIATKLFISEKTVKRHGNNIFKKLQVKNRREAYAKVEEMNIS